MVCMFIFCHNGFKVGKVGKPLGTILIFVQLQILHGVCYVAIGKVTVLCSQPCIYTDLSVFAG